MEPTNPCPRVAQPPCHCTPPFRPILSEPPTSWTAVVFAGRTDPGEAMQMARGVRAGITCDAHATPAPGVGGFRRRRGASQTHAPAWEWRSASARWEHFERASERAESSSAPGHPEGCALGARMRGRVAALGDDSRRAGKETGGEKARTPASSQISRYIPQCWPIRDLNRCPGTLGRLSRRRRLQTPPNLRLRHRSYVRLRPREDLSATYGRTAKMFAV